MKKVAVIFGLVSLIAAGETSSSAPEAVVSQTVTTPGNEAKIIGAVELRPSYLAVGGEFHTENYVQLGYQFSKSSSVYYRQEFNTNLFNPKTSAFSDVYAYDGSFRTKINNVWTDSAKFLSLSYEGRVYLPTYSVRRDAGMISSVRNYARLKANISPSFAVTIEEIPTFHFYDRAGAVASKGPEANPFFENRAYLSADYFITEKLKLYVPLILSSVRYRDFQAKAKNNDAWGHKLWLHPELTYAVTPTLAVGAAYYSDTLVTSDFSQTTISDAFKKGVPQIILNAAL